MVKEWYLLIDCREAKRIELLNGEGKVIDAAFEERGVGALDIVVNLYSLIERNSLGLSNLKAILVAEGPGSYTGLKIAASCANALSYSLLVPKYIFNGKFQKKFLKKPQKVLLPFEIFEPKYGGKPKINLKKFLKTN
jgi:tRNA A37 threonylcarbamoyladenosine modification protein TsaB